MIHKFISNDNKGNVNTVEIGSTYTKLGLVAAPVEDTDAANKAYVDSVAGGSSGANVLLVNVTVSEGVGTLDKTWKEIAEADFPVFRIDSGSGALWGYIIAATIAPSVDDRYTVVLLSVGSQTTATAASENDYPTFTAS